MTARLIALQLIGTRPSAAGRTCTPASDRAQTQNTHTRTQAHIRRRSHCLFTADCRLSHKTSGALRLQEECGESETLGTAPIFFREEKKRHKHTR